MADDEVTWNIEEALNKTVTTTDHSGDISKELKNTIYETVSTPKESIRENESNARGGNKTENQTDREINAMKTELDACRGANNNTNTEGS
jgi:hypothetical protein